jgi:RHS repeat-associated protein
MQELTGNRHNKEKQPQSARAYSKDIPELSLPKTSGSIRGIGEKFNLNPATGSGRITIPISIAALRGAPDLALSYDSGTGNSPFGLGWSVNLPTIHRKTEKRLPTYDNDDVFILSGTEDLVPIGKTKIGDLTVTTYMPRTEGSFNWIRLFSDSISSWWLTIDRNNIRRWFGAYPDKSGTIATSKSTLKICDPQRDKNIFSWLLAEERDDRGNRTVYHYVAEDAAGVDQLDPSESNRSTIQSNRYIKKIDYCLKPGVAASEDAWQASIIFDYGEHDEKDPTVLKSQWLNRPDPYSIYRSGFDVRTRRRCRRILQFHEMPGSERPGQSLNAATELIYDESHELSQLASVQHRRYKWQNDRYESESVPAATFTYSTPRHSANIRHIKAAQTTGTPSGLNDEYRFIDLDGESLSGILSEQGEDWYYRRNLGNGNFEPAHAIRRPSGFAKLAVSGQVAALENDGVTALYSYGASGGYTERLPNGTWDEFVAFPAQPNVDWSHNNVRWLDLDGDGQAELVILHDEVIEWHRNSGRKGVETSQRVQTGTEAEKGPARIFQDGLESIFTADMSGDGLTDIVRIRHGDICYWPNLGYGRFGPKVEMDRPPHFAEQSEFNPALVQLADIDGSGTTDVLYLDGPRTRYWINQSGNRWSSAVHLTQLPPTDSMTDVGMVDLLGNGTSCLVWSSRSPADAQSPWRYVELMVDRDIQQADVRSVPSALLSQFGVRVLQDGRADLSNLSQNHVTELEKAGAITTFPSKPYLLREIDNGMGMVTRFAYKPSTYFYLKDRAEGKPWITRLPFCVHVVDRQEAIDRVTGNRFVSRFSYHHGYYDRAEREFRGFGRVDQWDMEDWSVRGNQLTDRSPIITRSWFHTGAYIDEARVSTHFAGEYYALPNALSLPDSVIEGAANMTIAELRQAKRILRGQALRSEIYACRQLVAGQEKPETLGTPYVVRENRFRVRKWHENKIAGEFSVFHSFTEESLSVATEQDPRIATEPALKDPRISHELTLEADIFGQPIKQASIAYGRLAQGRALPIEQTPTRILINQSTLINKSRQNDWHRWGIPLASQSWELGTDLNVETDGIARADEIKTLFESATDITERQAQLNDGERRMLSTLFQLYRKDTDLGLTAQPLDLGEVESKALPARSYVLVYSPTDVEDADGVFSPDDFRDGKYLDPADFTLNPEHQTLTQFQQFIGDLPDKRTTNGHVFSGWWARDNEVAYSQHDFYAPVAVRDAWGNVTTIEMDSLSVAATKVTNPLGQTTTAEIDYRVMAPRKIVDANGTMQLARYDILGRPLQTTIAGANGEGDALDDLSSFDLSSSATSWATFSFFAGPNKPSYVHSWSRETHHSELASGHVSRWMESRVYTDGFGRDVLSKAKAAPGEFDFDLAGNPGNSGTNPRWVGSGRTVFDNKGNPVLQYELYFAKDVDYGDGAPQHGVTPILHYDPMDRVVMTEMPDGTRSRVEFTPWEQRNFDALDTFDALRSPQYSPVDPNHVDTPQEQYLDSLGRPFRTSVKNYDPVAGTTNVYTSNVETDIAGLALRTIDAKRQLALRQWFDRAGRPFKSVSNDAGTTYALPALDGQPFIQVPANGQRIKQSYDALRRPTENWVTNNGTPYLREAIVYADDQPAIAYGKGKPWRIFDPCGMTETSGYDFKGMPLATKRHILASLMNPAAAPPEETDWSVHDLTGALGLFGESFETTSKMDALGRPVAATAPDGSIQTFSYDDGGGLFGVKLDKLPGQTGAQSIVNSITYDSKGRRKHIAYGNGVETKYDYDPKTFRLTHLTSTRNSDVLQDLSYHYDPLGNIIRIRDRAQDAVITNNQSVEPERTFVYDSISRLVRADGREHIGQTQPDQRFRPDGLTPIHVNDINGLRRCSERWSFDEIGNFLRWEHQGPDLGQNWARDYVYAVPGTNRLTETSVTIGGTPQATAYEFDDAGNIVAFAHITNSHWNADNQPEEMLIHGNVTAQYRYDAGGERAYKRIEKPTGQIEIRLYLAGFEVYREFSPSGTLTLRRDSLHLMDGESRILMIETEKTSDDILAAQKPVQRWQISDHLGSSALELDHLGNVTSHEEYHAYGTSSWHWANSAISQKRYRYTGMERDEESGLQYHSARYYLPWLARWLSCDPHGMVDGASLWAYVRGNPAGLSDKSGRQSVDDPIILNTAEFKKLSAEDQISGKYWWAGGTIDEVEISASKGTDLLSIAATFETTATTTISQQHATQTPATGQPVSASQPLAAPSFVLAPIESRTKDDRSLDASITFGDINNVVGIVADGSENFLKPYLKRFYIDDHGMFHPAKYHEFKYYDAAKFPGRNDVLVPLSWKWRQLQLQKSV